MHQMPTITRQDGSTVTPTIITRGAGSRKAKTRILTEPVVSRYGDVIDSYVNTDLKNSGLRLVEQHDGTLLLTKHARDEGFVLYRDMCFGRVPGVAAAPAFWEIHQTIKEMVASNRRPKPGDFSPEDLYHPRVIELRAAGKDGVERIPKAELDDLIKTIHANAEDLDDEQVEARAEEIGMVRDEANTPSLDEAVKKGRKQRAH